MELMVAVFIGTIITVGTFSIYIIIQHGTTDSVIKFKNFSSSRSAVSMINNELKKGYAQNISTNGSSLTIGAETFTFSGNKLIRTLNGQTKTVALDVTGNFSISNADNNDIVVTGTIVSGNQTLKINTLVYACGFQPGTVYPAGTGIWNVADYSNARNGVPLIFTSKFYIGSQQNVKITISTEDTATVYIDGNPLWIDTAGRQSFSVNLSPGYHSVNVFAENTDGQNPVLSEPDNEAALYFRVLNARGDNILDTTMIDQWHVFEPSEGNFSPYFFRGTTQDYSGPLSSDPDSYVTNQGIPTGPAYINLPG